MKTSVWFLLLVCFLDQTNQQRCLQEVSAALRAMAEEQAALRGDMRSLQTEDRGQTAKLEEQRAEIDKLKKHLQVKQVAFSASLMVQGSLTFDPVPPNMIFKHVITNIGNAYNQNSGIFTAPVRGVYQFEWYIGQWGDASHPTGVMLVRNAELISTAWEQQTDGFASSSQGVNLILEFGDVVFLRMWAGTKVFDNQNHHTTFSGHLVFPM